MKYSIAAVAFLVAGAIAAPTASMIEDRRMTAIHVLYDNKESLQLTPEETDVFDKFMGMMGTMQQRDTEAGAPMTTGSAPAPGGGNPLGNLTSFLPPQLQAIIDKLTGGKKGGAPGGMMQGGMKKGGLLGGLLIPGLL
ncbi:hypothetical protein LEL_06107 [Akanthomyces lecanii RCEF 1005]|uniref:Uncharacterized protein n=1 Tax=Akanthomyces lecanii RCEF 1005 TaxID=1081108 RepID=A0A168GFJ2_CORDF|nr:hypothetical protein LEL_06107 [Akanthomyces lecanii RCEF 1005]